MLWKLPRGVCYRMPGNPPSCQNHQDLARVDAVQVTLPEPLIDGDY